MICHTTYKQIPILFYSIFVRHIQVMSDRIFDEAADRSQSIDFHEIMLKFTMDTFVE